MLTAQGGLFVDPLVPFAAAQGLFHSMFGGECLSSDFEDTRPGDRWRPVVWKYAVLYGLVVFCGCRGRIYFLMKYYGSFDRVMPVFHGRKEAECPTKGPDFSPCDVFWKSIFSTLGKML